MTNWASTGKEALNRTTQPLIQLELMPLKLIHLTDKIFQKKRFVGMWESNTMDGEMKSLDINKQAQDLSNGTLFSDIYPMDRKLDARSAFEIFDHRYQIPWTAHHLWFQGSECAR